MGFQRYRRLSAQQWRVLIEEQQRSGLSQRAFCAAHGLTVGTFKNWKQRLGPTPTEDGGFDRLFTPLGSVSLPDGGDEAGSGWEIEL